VVISGTHLILGYTIQIQGYQTEKDLGTLDTLEPPEIISPSIILNHEIKFAPLQTITVPKTSIQISETSKMSTNNLMYLIGMIALLVTLIIIATAYITIKINKSKTASDVRKEPSIVPLINIATSGDTRKSSTGGVI